LVSTSIKVEKIGRRKWRLLEEFITPHATVPAGFTTNGASSPRLLWPFVSPATDFFEAAVVHDYLLDQRKQGHDIPLSYANEAFYVTAKLFDSNQAVNKIAYLLIILYTSFKKL
jgi:hypothetical protein